MLGASGWIFFCVRNYFGFWSSYYDLIDFVPQVLSSRLFSLDTASEKPYQSLMSLCKKILKVPLCVLLATRAGAYEVMEAVCEIGKKRFPQGASCAEKAAMMAEMGASFTVKVRADSPGALAEVLAKVTEIDGYAVSTKDPLMVAAKQGFDRFNQELIESLQAGRIQGWHVGETIGSVVGQLAGGATLGCLGFVAGGVAGAAGGAAAGVAGSVPVAYLACSIFPPLCPYAAVSSALITTTAAAEGAVAGACVGGYGGARLGAIGGSKIGGLAGGVLGQEIGGTIGYQKALHGFVFKLPGNAMLAIDYGLGQDQATRALSYELVVQKKTAA